MKTEDECAREMSCSGRASERRRIGGSEIENDKRLIFFVFNMNTCINVMYRKCASERDSAKETGGASERDKAKRTDGASERKR